MVSYPGMLQLSFGQWARVLRKRWGVCFRIASIDRNVITLEEHVTFDRRGRFALYSTRLGVDPETYDLTDDDPSFRQRDDDDDDGHDEESEEYQEMLMHFRRRCEGNLD